MIMTTVMWFLYFGCTASEWRHICRARCFRVYVLSIRHFGIERKWILGMMSFVLAYHQSFHIVLFSWSQGRRNVVCHGDRSSRRRHVGETRAVETSKMVRTSARDIEVGEAVDNPLAVY
jgi:hypothetical protein